MLTKRLSAIDTVVLSGYKSGADMTLPDLRTKKKAHLAKWQTLTIKRHGYYTVRSGKIAIAILCEAGDGLDYSNYTMRRVFGKISKARSWPDQFLLLLCRYCPDS